MSKNPVAAPVSSVGQFKGGGGKSTTSRLMAERMIRWADEMGRPRPLIIDADTSLGNTEAHLKAAGAVRLQTPLHVYDGWLEMAQMIGEALPSQAVLIDFPGNFSEGLKAYGASFAEMLEIQGRPWTRVIPINTQAQAVMTVAEMAAVKPHDERMVVIMNGKWGPNRESFGYWHARPDLLNSGMQGGKQRAALLAAGGLEVYLPALEASVMELADSIDATFEEAANLMIARSHVFQGTTLRAWLAHANAMVEQMRSRLGY